MSHLRGVHWLKLKAENEGALMLVGQTLQILQEFEPLYREVKGWLCSCEKGRSWKCLRRVCNFLLPVIPGSSQEANL